MIMILVIYGKGDHATDVSIATFNDVKSAHLYVKSQETAPLREDHWVRCEFAQEFKKYPTTRSAKVDFENLMRRLDDRGIQKVLRETGSVTLAKALKAVNENTKKMIERNMSKRAWQMLVDDMNYMGPIRTEDCEEARDDIVSVIVNLEERLELVLRKEDEVSV